MFVEHKEALEAVEVIPAELKFSEALRIGARLRPQGRYQLFDGQRTCALGAMAEAMGWIPTTGAGDFGSLPERIKSWPLFGDVFKRNDTGWSREQIADWLEAQGY